MHTDALLAYTFLERRRGEWRPIYGIHVEFIQGYTGAAFSCS